MQQMQEAAIREYFFGDAKRTLSPHTQQVNFDDATIYKIQEGEFLQSAKVQSADQNSKCNAFLISPGR